MSNNNKVWFLLKSRANKAYRSAKKSRGAVCVFCVGVLGGKSGNTSASCEK